MSNVNVVTDIDFARAATLMDVVQKVASVTPTYTALSGVAMMELKEMNDVAQEHINELGRLRLKAEQEAAAELNAKNQVAMEAQAKIDRDREAQQAAAPKPITVMPGEPVPDQVKAAVDNPPVAKDAVTLEPIPPTDAAPVERRV